jgi:hypothetical protein
VSSTPVVSPRLARLKTDSPEPTSLLLIAMDHAVDRARAGNGRLIPFVVADRPGGTEFQRFPDEPADRALADAARFVAAECRGARAVLVYDGTLVQGEARFPAIYAESVDEHGAVTVVAQRYRPRKLLRHFELVGNPVQLAVKGVL